MGENHEAGGSWSGNGEKTGKHTKLTGQISLKGDATLLKLRKSILFLPDVRNKLSTGIINF